MLHTPVKPVGKWIMNNEGLKVLDGLNILVHEEKDINKAMEIGSILFDNFSMNSEGENNRLTSDQLENELKTQWEYYNTHCTECEKKLPKKYYSLDHKNLCGRCYKKSDSWFNLLLNQ